LDSRKSVKAEKGFSGAEQTSTTTIPKAPPTPKKVNTRSPYKIFFFNNCLMWLKGTTVLSQKHGFTSLIRKPVAKPVIDEERTRTWKHWDLNPIPLLLEVENIYIYFMHAFAILNMNIFFPRIK